MTMRAWFAAVLLTAMLLPCAVQAGTWWDKDWPYRKVVTIDTTSKGVPIGDPIGRAPLLVRLHSGNFNFEDAADNGADLRFVDSDDKTPLTYHIETYDPILGVATVWLDVKAFPVAAAKTVYMYYGNKKATPALDSAGTFDPDYTLVYHFDAATGAPPRDKTAYANNAQSAPTSIDDASVIGKGGRFTGAAPMIIPASPSLALAAGAPFTFSAWVKFDAPQARAAILVRQAAGSALVIGLDQGAPFVEAGGQRVIALTPLTKGSWGQIAVTADGHNLTLFVNGKQAGIAPAVLPAFDGPIALGADLPGGATGVTPYIGGMDEARLSKTVRTAGLIAMDAASQGAESRLVSIPDAGEKRAGVGFGLFGAIVKYVDATAWWVIGILAIMSAGSWVVMVTKVRSANASDRADRFFLKHFRELGEDVTALADEAAVGPVRTRQLNTSPIFRIYKAAADEIRHREVLGQTVLSVQAIEVVRALMDTNLTRENQKLSNNMVWLTVSISGGPFIGLLGTVIGVMLVFAGVAAAGDVNINAIAPGISAALLATVAGLTVAIPAMFGYNLIVVLNKNITANMHVFVDEFITRLCEYHSEPNAVAAE